LINLPGNPLNGLSLIAASAAVDQALTLWKGVPQATFDAYYAALSQINRACVGKLDTINTSVFPPEIGSWYVSKNLKIVGVALLPSFLIGTTDAPTTMEPLNLGSEPNFFEDEPLFENPNSDEVASVMKLYQNYPNPFNPSTSISFNLMQPAQVTLKVYNVLGQEIATLLQNEEMLNGLQSFTFDASGLSSGVYFYIVTGQELETGAAIPQSIGKMLLLK